MTGRSRSAFDEPVEAPPPGVPWTLLRLLRWSARYLGDKGIVENRLDAEHLLAHVLGIGRLELYLQFDRPLTPEELDRFRPLLLERAQRRPLQYILGRAPFRGLDLQVDPRVLIPRPETEELVDAVLARVRAWGRGDLVALEVGTGSGAIALALATEGPFARIVAIDVSAEAVEVAGLNAKSLGLDVGQVEFRHADLFGSGEERFDVIVSNPPYVSAAEHAELEPEVRDWEPRVALVAEDEGLAMVRRLVEGAPQRLRAGGLLALEVGATQAGVVASMIRAAPELESPLVLPDLSGRERFLLATRPMHRPPLEETDGGKDAEAAGPSHGRHGRQTEGQRNVQDQRNGAGARASARAYRRVPGSEARRRGHR